MAISIDPSTAPLPAPNASVLASLKAYVQLVETRRSLQAEMDQALSSFLTGESAPLANGQDVLSAPGAPAASSSPSPSSLSACAAEAIRPPTEQELQQVLQIAFGGLVEVKEQARLLVVELDERWDRADLARMVRGIEEDESARIKAVRQSRSRSFARYGFPRSVWSSAAAARRDAVRCLQRKRLARAQN